MLVQWNVGELCQGFAGLPKLEASDHRSVSFKGLPGHSLCMRQCEKLHSTKMVRLEKLGFTVNWTLLSSSRQAAVAYTELYETNLERIASSFRKGVQILISEAPTSLRDAHIVGSPCQQQATIKSQTCGWHCVFQYKNITYSTQVKSTKVLINPLL